VQEFHSAAFFPFFTITNVKLLMEL